MPAEIGERLLEETRARRLELARLARFRKRDQAPKQSRSQRNARERRRHVRQDGVVGVAIFRGRGDAFEVLDDGRCELEVFGRPLERAER